MSTPSHPSPEQDELTAALVEYGRRLQRVSPEAEAEVMDAFREAKSAILAHLEAAIRSARIDEVEKALQAGMIGTIPTEKGNVVEWWPDGLNKSLNNRLAQLRPTSATEKRKDGAE